MKSVNEKTNKDKEKRKFQMIELDERNHLLPRIETIQEYTLKIKVRKWSNDDTNTVMKSVRRIGDGLYQVKVAVKLDGEIIQQFIDFSKF